MAQKKPSKAAAPTNDELDKMFEGIGDDDASGAATAQGDSKAATANDEDNEDDPLAELKNLATATRPLVSRPGTPRAASSAATSVTGRGRPTPPSTTSGRSSEDKTTTDDLQDPAPSSTAGGSWWGGLSNLSALASSAIKQAEATVKEISSSEDAQKWTEQARNNYGGALKGLDGLRSRALPTFTSILHAMAPPISEHECLEVHITHDMTGYPSLNPILVAEFEDVMEQVEGGRLQITQRRAGEADNSAQWDDGYWWRQVDVKRDLSAVKGLVEGTKLVRVSAETFANEFYAANGGLEEAAKQSTASLSGPNPVRHSHIFLAIQAISYTQQPELFGGPLSSPKSKTDGDSVVIDAPKKPKELMVFAIYLYDPIHTITFSTLTQAVPQERADWLESNAEVVDDEIIDQRHLIAKRVEKVLSLGISDVAELYVAQRMGVGEGGLTRGKSRRREAVESNGGEAARAI